MIVDLIDPYFEFYKHHEPTGHYARGIVIKETQDSYRVELLCNGQKVWAHKSICKTIASGRTYGQDVIIRYEFDAKQ